MFLSSSRTTSLEKDATFLMSLTGTRTIALSREITRSFPIAPTTDQLPCGDGAVPAGLERNCILSVRIIWTISNWLITIYLHSRRPPMGINHIFFDGSFHQSQRRLY